jgi:hypothetical protein
MMSMIEVKRAAIGPLMFAISAVLAGSAAAQDSATLVRKTSEVDGQRFTFTKSVDERGTVAVRVQNASGTLISEREVPRAKPQVASDALSKRLATLRSDELLRVTVALELNEPAVAEPVEQGEVETLRGITTRTTLGGRDTPVEEFDKRLAETERVQLEVNTARLVRRQAVLTEALKRFGLLELKSVQESLERGSSNISVDLPLEQIRRLLESGDPAIVGIELAAQGEDDINQAMVDTNISTWALPFASTRGAGIGIYMTESGCADESVFSNYDRLAGSNTDHSRNVGGIIKAVAPDSFLYCRGSAVLPQNSDLDGVGTGPRIYVVTRSNSDNDNTDYTTLDRDWDNFVYDNLVATFNSGGNTGTGSGNVRSPGKGLNIVQVGNYNDSNNTIVGSSPFNDPKTGNDKPQLVAPGESITAGGFTMTGTSQATPHAAAFAADMMSASSYLKLRPQLVMAKMLAGATDPITGGYDKVGQGGIDFLSAQYSGHWAWWSGGNAAFNTFAQTDGGISATQIEHKVYIQSSWDKVRASLAWLNRGSYTYSHRNDAHAIGMDLDMSVYAPDGSYLGGSVSWDNPHETVNFTPTQTGYYTFKITRFANRDASSNFKMGLYVNYYE